MNNKQLEYLSMMSRSDEALQLRRELGRELELEEVEELVVKIRARREEQADTHQYLEA